MDRKKTLHLLLILNLVLALSGFDQTHAQQQHSLELERATWNHSTLRVLLTPPNNVSWWKPYYLDATVRAISQWNHGILHFASNYTAYSYLSNLRMTLTVAPTNDSVFDIFISWTETPAYGADAIGKSFLWSNGETGIYIDSSIYLSSKMLPNYVLSEVDMQNIALHELGHSLGLGHINRTGDVMHLNYPLKTFTQVRPLSTLDLYGVSIVFQWMSNSSPPYHYRPQQSSVTLPPSIAFQYLPISNADLPLSQLLRTFIQNLINNVMNLIKRPETVILIVATGVILLVAALILAGRRLKRPKTR